MNAELNNIDFVDVIEKYLILLLGVVDRPISTQLHLQKELFILTRSVHKISEYIVFEKHYNGPYSADLKDISNEPIYFNDSIIHDARGYHLSSKGKNVYNKIIDSNKNEQKFIEFLTILKVIRKLYDKLSSDELLFLIYTTYEEYTEYSSVSDRLLAPKKKHELASKLFKKGIITESRYNELVVE